MEISQEKYEELLKQSNKVSSLEKQLSDLKVSSQTTEKELKNKLNDAVTSRDAAKGKFEELTNKLTEKEQLLAKASEDFESFKLSTEEESLKAKFGEENLEKVKEYRQKGLAEDEISKLVEKPSTTKVELKTTSKPQEETIEEDIKVNNTRIF